MSKEDFDYSQKSNSLTQEKTVCIPISLFESIQGRYFVGQTETLFTGAGLNAWAGLVNPHKSNIDMYVNVFTVSNYSDDYLTAEIWLNTDIDEKGAVSHKVSPSNTAIKSFPENKADIRFIQSTADVPEHGINIYDRIVPPNSTLVGEEDGKFIEASGGNYVIVLKSSSLQPDKAIVAFGWWEKPVNC